MAENIGRQVNVSISRAALITKDVNLTGFARKQEEESDDFYEFTEEDYARMMAGKKPEIFLKTKKIRDAEAASRRARITKAIIRVQFPDNYILEAKFQPTDSLTALVDLLKKVILRTDLPFYLYTTPPKQRLQDLGRDFYTAGLTPGALLYFSYDIPKGGTEDELKGIMGAPYLRSDVMALRDLHLLIAPASNVERPGDTAATDFLQDRTEQQRPRKIGVKPKWMKL